MITNKDLEKYFMDSFKVKKIFDFICENRDIKDINFHDYKTGYVFNSFYQYKKGKTTRIEEDSSGIQKRKKSIDESDEDITTLTIKNQIFNEHITLRVESKTKIEIDNCIFEDGISIESLKKEPISVHLSCCIIQQSINLLRSNDYKKFSVNYSLVEKILLSDVNYHKISIGYSEVPEIEISQCEIQCFSTIKSHLNLILCDKTIINNNSIKMDSFDTYRVLKHINISFFLKEIPMSLHKEYIIEYKKRLKEGGEKDKKEELKRHIKELKTKNKKRKLERRKDARNYLLNFIVLISNSDDLSFETEINANLNYGYHKYKNNMFMRIFLYPVGYFYKPSRVIFTSIVLILLFGIIYKNIAGITTSLYDTIYFSGITFFTIGYSDVYDKFTGIRAVVKNVLVLLEGGLGISLCSSLLASLLNKYINK